MVDFMEHPNSKMDDDWGYAHDLGNLDLRVFFDKQCHWTMVVFECIFIDNTGRRLRKDLEVCPDDADDMAVMMMVGGEDDHGERLTLNLKP